MKKSSVSLIGAGAMGGALLRAWLSEGAIDPAHSMVFDPKPSDALRALCAEHNLALNGDVNSTQTDMLVAAVKPQFAADVLPQYAPIAKNSIVISVMAGKSISSIAGMLDGAPRVMRTMPNLPASIGKGMTGLFAPATIDKTGRLMVERLIQSVGQVVWVDTEQQIDFVTAISGSGPAYYFLMTEALAQAGEALGLTSTVAASLARATLTGAGGLMETDDRSPLQMRQAVTSPGGTTQAALEVLDGDGAKFRALVTQAVANAAKRAGELTD